MPLKPTATYRLQFTPSFGFRDAINLIPYLDRLGVSHIYASPLLKPSHGSEHGYDVVDPSSLNPELGEEREFQELLDELALRGMGLILDIVPNHMAVNGANAWWQDVLEHGQRSRFAHYFDIDWQRAHGRIVLPTLGDHAGTVLENGELSLGIDERGLFIAYYENRFPVDPASYQQVLVAVRVELSRSTLPEHGSEDSELEALIDLSREIANQAGNEAEIQRVSSHVGPRTWALSRSNDAVRVAFGTVFEDFNGNPGEPSSYQLLERLLESQPYQLTYWRRASEMINYRRFFDIGDLISLRIEDPDVFEAVHSLVLEYAGSDGLDGFRADHVDGLFDPKTYAERLHQRLREVAGQDQEFLLLFEKILTGHEQLPPDWEISGTTGYEFAHRVNAVQVSPEGFSRIERHFAELTGYRDGFDAVVLANKARMLDDLFAGEFHKLAGDLIGLARARRESRDVSQNQVLRALREVMVRLPVYRTYVDGPVAQNREREILQETLAMSRHAITGVEDEAWRLLEWVFLSDRDDDLAEHRTAWVRRWQQFTGPLMAKGLEDTALYVYTPVASLNEVGGEPETLTVEDFHRHNSHVASNWPDSMLTTSTHDTKRSEDVRARIAVLSEMAENWISHLEHWREVNAPLRVDLDGSRIPDANEEQLIYQTLLGSWPLDRGEFDGFRERVKQYMTKAMREAKVHTSWINVDEAHESAVLQFIDAILQAGPEREFFRELVAFQTRISSYGAWNSLAQLVLKLTSPGFPDIYQGNELWDFSLADPDNRRPVDFQRRHELLEQLEETPPDQLASLVHQWRDGRIKLCVTQKVLAERRQRAAVYQSGNYLPLSAEGEHTEHVIAFARRSGNRWALTVAPRLTAGLVQPDEPPVGESIWDDTTLILPDDAPGAWESVITSESVDVSGGRMKLADALSTVPVAVFRADSG